MKQSIQKLTRALNMKLEDHPGYFGITSQGVVAIHADWPVYPEEHGPDLALLWLTSFPEGTCFHRFDDINRCNLFLANVKCSNRENVFDERNFHVAVWHEDLLDREPATTRRHLWQAHW